MKRIYWMMKTLLFSLVMMLFSTPVALAQCPDGEMLDCNGNCAPEAWLGDGICDSWKREHNGNWIDFSCVAFNYDEGDCPVTGACCYSEGDWCEVGTTDYCKMINGVYLGDGTSCDGDYCPTATGACCIDASVCVIVTQFECVSYGAPYMGDDSDCDACTAPSGACCLPSGCQDNFDLASCIKSGGEWLGENTVCREENCVLRVGPDQPFNTIQDAVDAATDGDTVLVDPGIYSPEPGEDQVVKVVNKSIVIDGFADGVIIDGGDSARGVVVIADGMGENPQRTFGIRDIVIQNGSAHWVDYNENGMVDPWEHAGGGLLVNDYEEVTVHGVGVHGCTAPQGDGGGMGIFGSNKITMIQVPFVDCHAAGDGGGGRVIFGDSFGPNPPEEREIFILPGLDDGELERLYGMYAEGNTAGGKGGALSIDGALNFRCEDSVIEGNSALDGGGLNLTAPDHLLKPGGIQVIPYELEGNVFRDNEARRHGGGLHVERDPCEGGGHVGPDCEEGRVPLEVLIRDGKFEENRAGVDEEQEEPGNGGAARFENVNGVHCDTCEFNHNQAINGGAVAVENTFNLLAMMVVAGFVDSSADSNIAFENGGVIMIANADEVTFLRFIMESNMAGGSGGCLHGLGVDGLYAAYCTWRSNRAVKDGGALFVDGEGDGRLDIQNSTIENNEAGSGESAQGRGGGMCVQNLGLFAIFQSFVLGNRAGDEPSVIGYGGGINMWNIEEKLLEDLVVMDNLAVPGERGEGSGGGLNVQDDGDDGDFLGGGVNELKSCTFRGNTAPTGGGINFGEAGTSPTLTDTVVCGNAIGQIEGSFTDGGGNTIAEECPGDTCPADLTGNGQVDGADLTVVLGDWGLAESPADLNGDGLVDGADLTIVLAAWGPCA